MAVANIADGTMDFCCLIRCGLRLATGWMVSCRASAIRLYVCKTWKGPIDMNLAVFSKNDQMHSHGRHSTARVTVVGVSSLFKHERLSAEPTNRISSTLQAKFF